MCQINCSRQATHLVHAADRSGLSLDACDEHLDQAREAVAAMATEGVEIVTAPL
jgi:predicted DNA-binding protein (UPF0251 family)